MFCIRGVVYSVYLKGSLGRGLEEGIVKAFRFSPEKEDSAEKLYLVNDYMQVNDCMSVVGWQAAWGCP